MRIVIVTGSRSDRGALEMVGAELRRMAHRVEWIEAAGLITDPRTLSECVSVVEDVCTDMRFVVGNNRPDMLILHGDRYEILGAAMAANIMGVPIAHLGGGDITEGSQDDSYRHAITKLSHLHFATHQAAADRIIQMGEQPDRVHVVGDPSVDRAMATETMGREETFRAVGLAPPQKSVLVSFHPNPLGDTQAEFDALYEALARIPDDVAVVWIGPNADAGNDIIRAGAQDFCGAYGRPAVYHDNLDARTYFSLMRHCDVMVGNSSAGLIEAPVFGLPVVNIGDRQKGRPCTWNVEHCDVNADDIAECIRVELSTEGHLHPASLRSHYGDGHAAERIANVIGAIKDPRELVRKRFYRVRSATAIVTEPETPFIFNEEQ